MESETPKPKAPMPDPTPPPPGFDFLEGIQLDSVQDLGTVFNELELVHEVSERWNQVLTMKRVFNEDNS